MTSREVVVSILRALKDRGGFAGWWNQIELQDQVDIILELTEIVEQHDD